VFALPDPQYGEEVSAAIVKDPAGGEVTERSSEWAKSKLAAYKYPRRVIFTDSFPLGPSGKVLKRELVQQYAG
jgi:long-chain acyl-CoA synthetase